MPCVTRGYVVCYELCPTLARSESTTVIERVPFAGGIYRITARGGDALVLVDVAEATCTSALRAIAAIGGGAPDASSLPARYVFGPLPLPPPLVAAGAGHAMIRCPDSSRNWALSSSAKFCSSVMSSSSSMNPLQSMSNWARYWRHCFNE